MEFLTKSMVRLLDKGEPVPVLLEIQPELFEDAKKALPQFGLRAIWDISIDAHRFIALEAVPADLIPRLSDIPGVNVVHYDAPVQFYGPFGIIRGLQEGVRPKDMIFGKGISPIRALSERTGGKKEGYYGTKEVWKLTGGEQAKSEGYDGSKTKVCIIDTGVWNLHEALGRRVKSVAISRYKVDRFFDSSGHGTWCAAMVAGSEP